MYPILKEKPYYKFPKLNKLKKSSYVLLLTVGIVFYGCQATNQQATLAANRDLVKAYHQVWSNGQTGELDKLLASDYIGHFVSGAELKGVDGAKNGITTLRRSFPDWKEDIIDMVAEGDKVVTRYTSSGTHRGRYKDVDSTGKKVAIDEVSIYRIANGKIVEDWSYNDPLSLVHQLKGKN